MIAYLKGLIKEKNQGQLILDVSNVGYRIEVSSQTEATLPSVGETSELLIYHHFTDSEQRLFGFSSRKEKNLFEKLITVKGIGPKLGLTILSGMQAPELMKAIVSENKAVLSGISGIGKKTAERMVLELKDKLFDEAEPLGAGQTETGNKREEAVSALEALGFKKSESEKLIQSLLAENPDNSVADIVKAALSRLNR